jgi:nucleotide-binding universal stress UspA family protein
MSTFNRIMVPVDGSATSRAALVTALQLARDNGATVHLVHCLDEMPFLIGYEHSGTYLAQGRREADRILTSALDICRSGGVDADTQLVDRPGARLGETVTEEAEKWHADLIVVGTHGRRGIGRALLGSGAEQIIRMSTVPVLTIRGHDKD